MPTGESAILTAKLRLVVEEFITAFGVRYAEQQLASGIKDEDIDTDAAALYGIARTASVLRQAANYLDKPVTEEK